MSCGDPKACCDSSISSWRCSSVIELSIRWAAAARWASESSSSSTSCGLIGEEVAVLVHELGEVLVGVLPRRVLLEQVVEVGEHLRDGRPVLLGRALERLLHPGETLVEQLATEQVLDLLVRLAGLRGLPVVRRQLAHRRRGGRRQVVEHHLAEVAVLVGHRDVARELAALGEHGLVEQLAHLLHGAVEVVALQDVAAALRQLSLQLVEPGLVVAAAPEELAHRVLGRVAGHHVLPDGVERLGEVDRRGERVAAVVPREAAHRRGLPQLLAEPDVVGPRVAIGSPLDLLEAVRAVEGEGLLVAVDHLEPQLVTLDERLDLAEQPAPDARAPGGRGGRRASTSPRGRR